MVDKPRLAVIGLGFIGLPLSLSYAMNGAKVIGIDVLKEHVGNINKGITHHMEYYQGKSISDILREQLEAKTFYATTCYEEAASQVDNYVITVGIPVRQEIPDTSYLEESCLSLSKVLKKGDTIILRSTVVPGTTEELVLPILEKSGLKAGTDFYLAYCSERIAEGRAFEEFIHMPLALGGVNEESAERAKSLLSFVTKADIHVTDIKVVETAKVIENIQRDVNIAMVQQFARFAEKLGIDTFELIRIANTHKRVNLLTPGPGVGGYCLPNALYYLQPKAKELQVDISLLEKARQINDSVPYALVQMVKDSLEKQGRSLKGLKVAVLGLAMKDYSNDDRISPPHQLVSLLLEEGAHVFAYDPGVPESYPYKVNSLEEAVADAKALFLLTMQEEFKYVDWKRQVIDKMSSKPVILDGKNQIPRSLDKDMILIRI
ncbi:nucleotide sugar dehydrogenase [Microaerobacter geothermalis]|uniref:nucleotide sugar dehydrogenase n=1 Tax=Microaerobacter geothermalis TaxID=674972 RepID=UPI001F41625B|nr:nucleotide sugar dehydrogenase [Microaerobacter geothermalis]MCF6092559.1 nucleotide sugar dehydrogenase [Microaerobacter geothermalis]